MDRNKVIPDHQSFQAPSSAQSKMKGKQSHSGRRSLSDLLLLSKPKNRIELFAYCHVCGTFYFPSARNPQFYVHMALTMMSFRFLLFVSQSIFEIKKRWKKFWKHGQGHQAILEFQCHITAGESSHDFVLRLYKSCVGGQSKRFIYLLRLKR